MRKQSMKSFEFTEEMWRLLQQFPEERRLHAFELLVMCHWDGKGEDAKRVLESLLADENMLAPWYLKVQKSVSTKKKEHFIHKYIIRNGKMPDEIGDMIRRMSYRDFLLTPYWKSIALFVKGRTGNRCAICGSTDGRMDVHHKTYSHHGDEIHHLDDLEVVCRKCHKELHGEDRVHKVI